MAGNMRFSHAVGYRGLASIKPSKIGGETNDDHIVLLCTGGNISLTQDPIMSGGVWGAGYANAAPIAYAFNYLALEGSINFEWVNQSTVWEALKAFAFTDRTEATEVHLLPDGANGFHGDGWCSSISFEASEGAALTGSMNFKGDPSDSAGGIVSNNDVLNLGIGDNPPSRWNGPDAYGGTFNDGTWQQTSTEKLGISGIQRMDNLDQSDALRFGMGHNGVGLVGATLIPYWNTKVSTWGKYEKAPDGKSLVYTKGYFLVDDVINWSCSYTSDLQVLKCCSFGKHLDPATHTPIGADYILCGEMSGEGSLTVFALRESGACSFAPVGFHTRKKNLTFTLGGFDVSTAKPNGTPKCVVVPNALINNGSTSMATGASYITCEYSFTAIGDGVNSVLQMMDADDEETGLPPEPEE